MVSRAALTVCCIMAGLAALIGVAYAARTIEREPLPSGSGTELIVFEVDGCNYCQLFRRDVLPAYQLSPRAAEVPIRFVDLNIGARGLLLDGPIDVVPTAVLMRDNRESGRITGYAGPESFFRMMRYLLGAPG